MDTFALDLWSLCQKNDKIILKYVPWLETKYFFSWIDSKCGNEKTVLNYIKCKCRKFKNCKVLYILDKTRVLSIMNDRCSSKDKYCWRKLVKNFDLKL